MLTKVTGEAVKFKNASNARDEMKSFVKGKARLLKEILLRDTKVDVENYYE